MKRMAKKMTEKCLRDMLNDFLKKYKEFHKADPDNWKRPITRTGIIIGCEKISTEEEYNEMYYGEGKHFDRFEKRVMPKVKEHVERAGTSELEALIKCTDPKEFWRQWASFQSEAQTYLFLRDLFDTVAHPQSGYDFEFTYDNEKYRVECVSPQKGESGLQSIDYSRPQVRVAEKGSTEYQIKKLRIINSISSKVKQLEKMEDYAKSFNFIFIDLTPLFWDTGAIGLFDKTLKELFYSKKNDKQLSREETKIEITKNVHSYDSSFCSDSMKHIHGIFIARSLSLADDQKQGVNLYINPNAPRRLPNEFSEKIQSSETLQVCVHDGQE